MFLNRTSGPDADAPRKSAFDQIVDMTMPIGTILRCTAQPGSRGDTFRPVVVRVHMVRHVFEGGRAWGHIIRDGQVTKESCSISMEHPIEFAPDIEIQQPAMSLDMRMREMKPGDKIEVPDYPIQSVRSMAARNATQLGRRYSVSTKTGICTVIRMDGATREQLNGVDLSPTGGPRDPNSLHGQLRDMNVGDFMDMPVEDYPVSSVRMAASQVGEKEGRKYTVNKTDDGCRITRRE